MAHTLVIVESPNKVQKIQGFLGDGYRVRASLGHIRDLPQTDDGDLHCRFDKGRIAVNYRVIPNKQAVVSRLRAEASEAERVVLATDPDREGEAIAWHLSEVLGRRKYQRAKFHAITEADVRKGVAGAGMIDMRLVDAQQARRVLDRVVGWLVSPTCKKGAGDAQARSAGRVQSVALRILAEREQQIAAFHSVAYFTLVAQVEEPNTPPPFTAALLSVDGVEVGQSLTDPAVVEGLRTELSAAAWRVAALDVSEAQRSPPPPFITSTVQQAASLRLGWPPDKTMQVCQALFEGGHITYHRTDSPALSPEAVALARAWIGANLPPEFLPANSVKHQAKVANAQEAHEAIRPTHPEGGPDALGDGDQAMLYALIWRQFIASQMTPGADTVVVLDLAAGNRAIFRARGVTPTFLGWRAIMGPAGEDEDDEDAIELPRLPAGTTLRLLALDPSKRQTKAPPRFSQASLIKALEVQGVGRPSTFAAIVHKIMEMGYVVEKKRKLVCTDTGLRLVDFLVRAYAGDFIEISYTGDMEGRLDAIARGECDWHAEITGASQRLLTLAQAAGLRHNPLAGEHRGGTAAVTIPGVCCPKCNAPMVERNGTNGKFYGCSKYPKCKGTRQPDPPPAGQRP